MLRSRIARVIAGALVSALVIVGLAATPAVAADITRIVTGHVYVGSEARSAVEGEVSVTARRVHAPDFQVTALTDANGDFVLTIPTQTVYTEFVFDFSYLGDDDFYFTRWPGVAVGGYVESSTEVDLIAGDRSGLDTTMPGPSSVDGHVDLLSAVSREAGDVSVYYHRQDAYSSGYGAEVGPIPVDEDGDWSADLAPGRYQFRYDALPAGFVDVPYPGANSTVIYGDQELTTQVLVPVASVSGTVELGLATPRVPDPGEVVISWKTSSSPIGPWPEEAGGTFTTDVQGNFLQTGMQPGYYQFAIDWVGDGPDRYLDQPFQGWFLNLPAGGSLRDVELALYELHSLSGQIKVGTRTATAGEVKVVYSNYLSPQDKSSVVDAAGRYTLADIVEGDSFDVLFQYQGRSGYVGTRGRIWDIAGDRTLDVTLVRGASVWGTVGDSSGAGVPGVDVTLTSIWRYGEYIGEVADVMTATTDESGFYGFNGINTDEAFSFYLTYERDGYAFLSWPNGNEFAAPGLFRLAELEIKKNVNVTMYRSGLISGVVTAPGVSAQGFADGEFGVQLMIRSGTRWIGSGYWEPVAADGSYTLTELSPGGYRVQAAYLGTRGEASVMSPALSLVEAGERTFSPAIRPFSRDLTGDSISDVLIRYAGTPKVYPGNGAGKVLAAVTVGSAWSSYTQFAQTGDLDGDDFPDVLTRDTGGNVLLYRGDGAGGWLGTQAVGVWASQNKIVAPGDMNGDGANDVLTRDTNGNIWLRLGDGAGGFAAPTKIRTGWGTYRITAAGDFNEDSFPDLFVLVSGTLYLYPGDGAGNFKPRVTLKSSLSYNVILGVGDFNGDWHPDLLARDSAGVLWLYRGTTSGTVATRVKVSSGWGSRTFSS
jgi:hypothetical protein